MLADGVEWDPGVDGEDAENLFHALGYGSQAGLGPILADRIELRRGFAQAPRLRARRRPLAVEGAGGRVQERHVSAVCNVLALLPAPGALPLLLGPSAGAGDEVTAYHLAAPGDRSQAEWQARGRPLGVRMRQPIAEIVAERGLPVFVRSEAEVCALDPDGCAAAAACEADGGDLDAHGAPQELFRVAVLGASGFCASPFVAGQFASVHGDGVRVWDPLSAAGGAGDGLAAPAFWDAAPESAAPAAAPRHCALPEGAAAAACWWHHPEQVVVAGADLQVLDLRAQAAGALFSGRSPLQGCPLFGGLQAVGRVPGAAHQLVATAARPEQVMLFDARLLDRPLLRWPLPCVPGAWSGAGRRQHSRALPDGRGFRALCWGAAAAGGAAGGAGGAPQLLAVPHVGGCKVGVYRWASAEAASEGSRVELQVSAIPGTFAAVDPPDGYLLGSALVPAAAPFGGEDARPDAGGGAGAGGGAVAAMFCFAAGAGLTCHDLVEEEESAGAVGAGGGGSESAADAALRGRLEPEPEPLAAATPADAAHGAATALVVQGVQDGTAAAALVAEDAQDHVAVAAPPAPDGAGAALRWLAADGSWRVARILRHFGHAHRPAAGAAGADGGSENDEDDQPGDAMERFVHGTRRRMADFWRQVAATPEAAASPAPTQPAGHPFRALLAALAPPLAAAPAPSGGGSAGARARAPAPRGAPPPPASAEEVGLAAEALAVQLAMPGGGPALAGFSAQARVGAVLRLLHLELPAGWAPGAAAGAPGAAVGEAVTVDALRRAVAAAAPGEPPDGGCLDGGADRDAELGVRLIARLLARAGLLECACPPRDLVGCAWGSSGAGASGVAPHAEAYAQPKSSQPAAGAAAQVATSGALDVAALRGAWAELAAGLPGRRPPPAPGAARGARAPAGSSEGSDAPLLPGGARAPAGARSSEGSDAPPAPSGGFGAGRPSAGRPGVELPLSRGGGAASGAGFGGARKRPRPGW